MSATMGDGRGKTYTGKNTLKQSRKTKFGPYKNEKQVVDLHKEKLKIVPK